jgi:hypothetical protein
MNNIKVTTKNIIPLYDLWEAYWDADYNIIMQDGYVKSWGSVKSKHRFVQTVSNTRYPLFESQGFDGNKSCLYFDGTDDYLIADTVANIFSGNDTNHSIVMHIEVPEFIAGTTVMSASISSGTGQYIFFNIDAVQTIKLGKRGVGDGSSIIPANGVSINPLNTAFTSVYTNSGTTINMYRNGSLVSGFPNTVDAGDLGTIQYFTLGALRRTSVQQYAKFRIRRLAITSTVLSSDDALELHNIWNNT